MGTPPLQCLQMRHANRPKGRQGGVDHNRDEHRLAFVSNFTVFMFHVSVTVKQFDGALMNKHSICSLTQPGGRRFLDLIVTVCVARCKVDLNSSHFTMFF